MDDMVLFLGTAGDAVLAGRQRRASGGIIIRQADTQFHIDPGAGATVRALQYDTDPTDTAAVLLSGTRMHALGVNSVLSAMTSDGEDEHGLILASERMHGDEIMETYISSVQRSVNFTQDTSVGVNEVEISGIPVTGKGTGFLMEGPKSTIAYTGVTGYNDAIPAAIDRADVLIVCCKHVDSTETNTLNLDQATRLIDKVDTEIAVLTGFGIDAVQESIEMGRHVQKETGVNTIAGKDGLLIDPETFSSSVRQKRLRDY